jgi:hypothetical protein
MCGFIGALTCILNVHITPKHGIQRSAPATRIKQISRIMQHMRIAIGSTNNRNLLICGFKD